MTDEEIKQNYEMFKRVLAFTEMNKDVINQYPQLKDTVGKFKELIDKLDQSILEQCDEKMKELMKRMNVIIDFSKQFGDGGKN